MAVKAWWYIFRVSDRGALVQMVAGPFKVFRAAHAHLAQLAPPPVGSQLVIDSVHYDPNRLGGRGIGAQEQNFPHPSA